MPEAVVKKEEIIVKRAWYYEYPVIFAFVIFLVGITLTIFFCIPRKPISK
jgi:hypothetical protein